MKTMLTLIFGLILILPSSAQTIKPDRETDGLKGPVKTVRVEIVTLDGDSKPNKNGRWLSRLTSYNLNGNKTEYEDFYAYGRISYGKLIYTYDDGGRLVEEEKHLNGSVFKQAYVYDDQKAAIKPDDVVQVNRFVFDAAGRLKEIVRSRHGSVFNRRVFNYDHK